MLLTIKKMLNMKHKRIILVGKAASGKDYIRKIFEAQGFKYAVSYTTRSPRPDEIGGQDYLFIKQPDAQDMIDKCEFYEWVAFNGSGMPDIEVIPSNEAAISGLFESQSSYKEHKYSVSDLSEFASFAVKIVMKASNPCYTPKIQDARIIAAY